MTVTVGKATPTVTPPTVKTGLVYDGNAQNLIETKGTTTGGTMLYSIGSSSVPGNDWKAELTATSAGSYGVWYKVVENNNYKGTTPVYVGEVTIAKADATVTAPTANTLTYNGEDQKLVAAGSTTGGTMKYSLSESGEFSTDIPTAVDAGTYTVWFKVVGGSNYNDVAAASVTVTIAKATPTVTAPVPVSDLVSTGGELTLINPGATTGGTMQYALGTENAVTGAWGTDLPKGTAAGDYYVWYQVEGDNNYNDVDPKFVKVTIADAGSTPVVLVTGVALDKGTMTLTVGGSSKLTATVDPADATNKAVTWTSSNPAVATVDADGKVTAVGVGTATITVTTADGGFTATCVVTVNAAGGSGGGSGSGGGGHYWHYDYNGDGKCDYCGSATNCKHTDANKDGKCDICYACIKHVDKNNDGFCDLCKNKIVESGKTFDAGVVLYAGMAALAATGSAVVIGKKRKSK